MAVMEALAAGELVSAVNERTALATVLEAAESAKASRASHPPPAPATEPTLFSATEPTLFSAPRPAWPSSGESAA